MQIADIVANRSLPINGTDLYPKITSVQFTGEQLVAIGMIDDRKILFIFNIKQKYPSPLVSQFLYFTWLVYFYK